MSNDSASISEQSLAYYLSVGEGAAKKQALAEKGLSSPEKVHENNELALKNGKKGNGPEGGKTGATGGDGSGGGSSADGGAGPPVLVDPSGAVNDENADVNKSINNSNNNHHHSSSNSDGARAADDANVGNIEGSSRSGYGEDGRGNSPDNYTPYDYRYGIPDDFSDDENDHDDADGTLGFRHYASILNEDSVLDEASLVSETPAEFRRPHNRRHHGGGKGTKGPEAPRPPYGKGRVAAGPSIQGHLIGSNITEGSITSMVGKQAKLDRGTMERHLKTMQKKLAHASREIMVLRGRMDKSAVATQMDKYRAVIREQATTIKAMRKDRKALEGVVRSQSKTLAALNGKNDSNEWSDEGQVAVLLERVRQLQQTNQQLRERDKAMIRDNQNLEGKVRKLRSQLIATKGRQQYHGDMPLGVNEASTVTGGDSTVMSNLAAGTSSILDPTTKDDSVDMLHSNPSLYESRQQIAQQKRQPSAIAVNERIQELETIAEKAKKEKESMARLLKSYQQRQGNDKAVMTKQLEKANQRIQLLTSAIAERNKEARMHTLTVKKLKATCEDLERGNRQLAKASAIYATGLNLESQSTVTASMSFAGPRGFQNDAIPQHAPLDQSRVSTTPFPPSKGRSASGATTPRSSMIRAGVQVDDSFGSLSEAGPVADSHTFVTAQNF